MLLIPKTGLIQISMFFLITRYSWAITECAYCRNHMGWLFTATKNHLRPTKFWGLCRGSLKPLLKIDDEDGKFTLVM